MKIELNSDQLIDLLYEKKITLGNIEISVKNTLLGTLSQLEFRSTYGKTFNRSNSAPGRRHQKFYSVSGKSIDFSQDLDQPNS